MINRIFKNFNKFYQVSFVLIMCLTLGSIFYFWNKGFIDGSRTQDLHQASFLLESLTKKNQFEEIKNLVHQENAKAAIQKMKSYEEELSTIDRQVSVSEFKKLRKSLQDLKSSAAKLISFSKSDQVISVFSKKLDRFNSFVRENNWKTLTRMSERISVQVSGHLNKNQLNKLAGSIKNEFDQMIKITENSILSRQNKSEVVSRLNNLDFEMDMLSRYAVSRNAFNSKFSKANKSLNLWLDKVAPEITLSKLEMQEIGRYYVMGMLATLFLTAVLFVASFFFNNWFMGRARRSLESELEGFVTDGLIGGDEAYLSDFSRNFQAYATKMSSYIDKRMSFGSVFQDALPLSSILLDQNLKVIWSNQQFCDGWKIAEEEINKDYMSWDYLNKLTNIGSDDPVLEALKNDVAGIYQVQIKPHDKAEVRPFEMFVSPVKYKNEKRIMLFFYDLTNSEETIRDQAKSILNPVRESLSLFRKGAFEESEQLEYEFDIAGTTDIYNEFIELNFDLKEKQGEANEEIVQLRSQVGDLDKQIEDIFDMNDQNIKIGESNIDALKVFKNNVISLSDLSKDLDAGFVQNSSIISQNLKAMKESVNKIKGAKSIVHEVFESLEKLDQAKAQIKQDKVDLQDKRARLGHELSQLSILMKNADTHKNISKLLRTFDKIQTTFDSYNLQSENLTKKLATLDIYMSKTQMVLSSSQNRLGQIDTNLELEQIQSAEDILIFYNELSKNSSDLNANYEEEIVMALQRIFKGTQSTLKNFGEIKLAKSDVEFLNEANFCPLPGYEGELS